jgi:histidyl-tRNA synthetase
MQKPSNPKGTRDFTPREVRNREAILNIIKDCFRRFGFEPIETPAFENLSTLTGKYGAEGDKLLFRILNSGDVYSKLSMDKIQSNHEMLSEISKKGLRYDLTVPFARYVVQHSNELVFPFRRYQIQPVWRADRPGKGRFQEFTQCDADIIGSNSLLGESELVLIYSEVLEKLGLGTAVLRINHRKLLEALIQKVGISQDMNWFTSRLGIQGR